MRLLLLTPTYNVPKDILNIADTPPDTSVTTSPKTAMEVDAPELEIKFGSGCGPTGRTRAGTSQPDMGTRYI